MEAEIARVKTEFEEKQRKKKEKEKEKDKDKDKENSKTNDDKDDKNVEEKVGLVEEAILKGIRLIKHRTSLTELLLQLWTRSLEYLLSKRPSINSASTKNDKQKLRGEIGKDYKIQTSFHRFLKTFRELQVLKLSNHDFQYGGWLRSLILSTYHVI